MLRITKDFTVFTVFMGFFAILDSYFNKPGFLIKPNIRIIL